jgi:hypothetical protein
MAAVSIGSHRAVTFVLALTLLIGVFVIPVVTGEPAAQQSEPEPETDNTVTRINIYQNGSAHWTVRIRTRLSTDQQAREYAAFQDQFRENTKTYLGSFRTRIQGVVRNAKNATDRQMQATGFTASTSIQQVPRRWGVVTYEFTWINLATQQSTQWIVGDIFQGGFFLANNDSLQVIAPDGYKITNVAPDSDRQDANVVTWNGREDFPDAHPRIVFSPSSGPESGQTNESSLTATEKTDTAVNSSLDGGNTPRKTITAPPFLGLVVIALVGWVIIRYGHRVDSDYNMDIRTQHEDQDQDQKDMAPPATEQSVETSAQTEEKHENEAVLTENEQVIALLTENGGRMRQAAIAEELGWSASKTSRVIGEMSNEQSVDKLRIGRENLVALPDESD